VPFYLRDSERLLLVPNTVASRSVITSPTFHRLRRAGLIGADIVDFPSGGLSCVLQNVTIAGQAAPDVEVRIRDVDELLGASGQYLVDGYLGLDYLFGAFASLSVDTQSLQVRLGLRSPLGTT
jgi:hypothetical protein